MKAYLDNSATTRPTERVIERMASCMREGFYNPSSLYAPAIGPERMMKACREQVARAIGGRPECVYFTSGGTEANNLAILGAVGAMRGEIKRVIATAVEHPSVLAACERLKEDGHRVTLLPVDAQGQPDWAALDAALVDAPDLVSCMQVNNETGAMPDLLRLVKRVRAAAPQALIHVDGVQGFLRAQFDVGDVDLYAMSAHKIHGPKGVGALYAAPRVRLKARQLGGGQEGDVRSGTENTPGIAGFSEAIDELFEMDAREEWLRGKKARLYAGLQQAVPELLINGPDARDGAPHILNASFPGVRGEVMLHALEGEGVYCSTGSACSSKKRKLSPVLLAMGLSPERVECALRFSLSPHTLDEEIDYAARKAGELYQTLRRFKRR